MVLTGFFDSLMVAKLGHVELAASGICNSIFFLISIFPMGVTMAYATIISLLLGRNKIKITHLLVRDSFYVTLFLCLITTLVVYWSIYGFGTFDQTKEVEVLSKPYLTLLMWSLAPMLLFFYSKNICDGYGYTRGGMVITVLALLLNIFLNWVFIYGNLGFSAYGLNGAGYATIISRIFLAAAMFTVLFKSKQTPISFAEWRHSFTNYKQFRFFKQIFKLGFPTGLQYFFEIAAFAVAAMMAGWIGSKELAAHQLAITLASVTYMFAGGISAGSSICVAKATGNKNKENALKYGKAGHVLGVGVMGLFALFFLLFNIPLAQLFSADADVVKLGANLLILAALFQLGDGLQAISVGLLRGIEDVNIPSFVTFVAYWLVAIPLGYFLLHNTSLPEIFIGVKGIWIGLAFGLTISAILLTYRFYYLLRSK
jgi:MATE family multidrug resistance protein